MGMPSVTFLNRVGKVCFFRSKTTVSVIVLHADTGLACIFAVRSNVGDETESGEGVQALRYLFVPENAERSMQFDVFVNCLRAFEAAVYILKVLPELSHVLFNLLWILFADDDSLDELGDVGHVVLLHS